MKPAPSLVEVATYPHLGETISIGGAELVVDAIDLAGEHLTISGSLAAASCTLTVAGSRLEVLSAITRVRAHPAPEGADGQLHIGDTIKAGSGKVIWTITAFSYGWNGRPQLSVRSNGPTPQGNTFSGDQLQRLHHVDVMPPDALAQPGLFEE